MSSLLGAIIVIEYVQIKQACSYYPVYHHSSIGDRSKWNTGEGISYRQWVTDWYEQMDCGVKLPITSVFIQRSRADLFARPCKRCFPDT